MGCTTNPKMGPRIRRKEDQAGLIPLFSTKGVKKDIFKVHPNWITTTKEETTNTS